MSLATIAQIADVSQSSVPTTYTGLILGAVIHDFDRSSRVTAAAMDSRVTDVWTPSVGGAYTEVTFTPPGGSASTLPAAGSTAANLAADLADTSTALGRAVTAYYEVNSTTAVCTAKVPGSAGTFANTTGITWTHTASGASGTNLLVGSLMCRGALTGAGVANVAGMAYPADSLVSGPTAKQVITLTGSSIASGDQIRTVVRMRARPGLVCEVVTAFDTNNNTTMATHATALDSALNTVFGAGYGAVAANASADITITADVIGAAFEVESSVTGSGGGAVAKAYTTGQWGALSTDIHAGGLLGVLTRNANVTYDATNGNHVEAGRLGEVLRHGVIAVTNSQSPTGSDAVWVDPATGLFYNAGASGYLALEKDVALWKGAGSGGLAPLQITL